MINTVLLDVIKVFVLDIVVLLSLFVLIYLITTLVNSIRNGKEHKLTKDSIMGYSFDNYMRGIKKNCAQLIKWFIICFAVHLVITFFNSLLTWLTTNINYDTMPLVALIVDILTPIFQVITPFYLPAIIIIGVGLLLYALIKTLNQVQREKNNNESIVKAVGEVVNEQVKANPQDRKLVPIRKKPVIKIKKSDELSFFTENLQKGFLGIAKFLPKLFIVLTICLGLNSLFLTVNNITKTVDNYRKISELNITIKNLSSSESFARITLLNEINRGGRAPIKTYKVDVLDNDGDVISTQSFQLEGSEIVVDNININFDYSRISNGERINIAYPYRVYSEFLPPSKAKPLTCMYNENEVPIIYMLEEDEIYGLEKDVYYKRLQEIFDVIKDENRSREMGIKSTIGNALHFTMHQGDIMDINIEGTGGVSAKKHETLFTEEEKQSLSL